MNLRPNYKWYVVGMLWWISFFNYADRQAIFSVFSLLRYEMCLSKVELGLLGSSFAWVYGLGAPIAGMVVDRIRRKTAILGGLHVLSCPDDRQTTRWNADIGVAQAQGSDAQGPVGVVVPLVVSARSDPESLPDVGREAGKDVADVERYRSGRGCGVRCLGVRCG